MPSVCATPSTACPSGRPSKTTRQPAGRWRAPFCLLLLGLAELSACAHAGSAGNARRRADAAAVATESVDTAKKRTSVAATPSGKSADPHPPDAADAAATPAAPTEHPALAAPTDAAPPVATAGHGPISLGVFAVALPACLPEPTPVQAAFCTDASRAIRRAYEDDDDDPAVLLALSNAVEVQPELAALAPQWRDPLGFALTRAEGLARLGPVLRLLRRAVADAYLDRTSQLYRGIDAKACREAFARLPADEPHWLEMVVTIEPLGTYPLSRLRRFCLQDRTLGQQQVTPPTTRGPRALVALVRRHWQAWHMAGRGAPTTVRVLQGWKANRRGQGATMTLAVAAEKALDGPSYGHVAQARCTQQRLVLRRRNRHAAPVLAYVVEQPATACTPAAHG